ncbi:MAG: PadR family transcriptional regulator [Chitinophagales bacterium]
MSFKQMLLGYLLDSPSHGYEIMKKAYSEFYPVGPEVNEGLLYTTLKKLEAENLIKREADEGNSRKKVEVTEAGRQEFVKWLISDEEDGGPRYDFFNRYPFLEKCNYFKYLTPEEASLAIEQEIKNSCNRLVQYRQTKKSMISKGVNHYRIAIIKYGIINEELRIKWLSDLRKSVGTKGD